MGHAVTAQVQRVEVAGGVFGGGERCGPTDGFLLGRTLAGRCLVMAGGGDEVAVAGVDVEVVQTLESREWIGHCPAHVGLKLGKNVSEQGKAALALETLEEGRQENFGIVTFGEILKEVAPALEKPETPANARFKPQRIGKSGAASTEP
jgi:hypothetical protein